MRPVNYYSLLVVLPLVVYANSWSLNEQYRDYNAEIDKKIELTDSKTEAQELEKQKKSIAWPVAGLAFGSMGVIGAILGSYHSGRKEGLGR